MNRYLVTVHYREPTYERHTHDNVSRLHPYKATYEVFASSEERAMKLAVGSFKFTAMNSSCGWVRLIEQVECVAIGDNVETRVMKGA